MNLMTVETPALILDKTKLLRNVARMTDHLSAFGTRLRPHMKTAKSIDVARMAIKGNFGGVTVATLNEAEYFVENGITDITYGVCITPDKLERVRDLQYAGASMTLITDSVEVAEALAGSKFDFIHPVRVQIEVDCGEHRTGVPALSKRLLRIAELLQTSPVTSFAGIFAHAGHSYNCRSIDEIRIVAGEERTAVLTAVQALEDHGIPCTETSVGSTPTAFNASTFDGVTEVRAGVYMFNDLFQSEMESCGIDDIAVSVLSTVVSHDRKHNRLLIDAGGLALSKDRSTAKTPNDYGFGRLVSADGQLSLGDICVVNTHQEHGEVHSDEPIPFESLPIGSRVRVLPNHACMTCAMYDQYYVVEGQGTEIIDTWGRTNGWRKR